MVLLTNNEDKMRGGQSAFVFCDQEKTFSVQTLTTPQLGLVKYMRECKHDYFNYISPFIHHLVCSIVHQLIRCIVGITTKNTSMEAQLGKRHYLRKDLSSVDHHESDMADIFGRHFRASAGQLSNLNTEKIKC